MSNACTHPRRSFDFLTGIRRVRAGDTPCWCATVPVQYDWSVANGPAIATGKKTHIFRANWSFCPDRLGTNIGKALKKRCAFSYNCTETSDLRWENIVPWSFQPQLTSPPSGGVSNANDPPWYATLPMHSPDPVEYADYPWLCPFPSEPDGGGSFGWRPKACLRHTLASIEASRQRLGANHSLAGATFEDFVDASMNVEVESAKHLLESLLELVAGSAECAGNELCSRALAVLQAWDRFCAPESVGALLFDRFRAIYLAGNSEWSEPFDLADPIETPRGIPAAEVNAAVVALIRAATEMELEDGQPLDLAWGEFKKLPPDVNDIAWGLSGSQDDSVRNSHSSRRPDAGATTTTGTKNARNLATHPPPPPQNNPPPVPLHHSHSFLVTLTINKASKLFFFLLDMLLCFP